MSDIERQKKQKKQSDLRIKLAELSLANTKEVSVIQAKVAALNAELQENQKQYQLDVANLNAGG